MIQSLIPYSIIEGRNLTLYHYVGILTRLMGRSDIQLSLTHTNVQYGIRMIQTHILSIYTILMRLAKMDLILLLTRLITYTSTHQQAHGILVQINPRRQPSI